MCYCEIGVSTQTSKTFYYSTSINHSLRPLYFTFQILKYILSLRCKPRARFIDILELPLARGTSAIVIFAHSERAIFTIVARANTLSSLKCCAAFVPSAIDRLSLHLRARPQASFGKLAIAASCDLCAWNVIFFFFYHEFVLKS